STAGRNEPGALGSDRVDNDEHARGAGEAGGNEPRRVERVDVQQEVDVLEHSGGFKKGHAVLLLVDRRLGVVPFEVAVYDGGHGPKGTMGAGRFCPRVTTSMAIQGELRRGRGRAGARSAAGGPSPSGSGIPERPRQPEGIVILSVIPAAGVVLRPGGEPPAGIRASNCPERRKVEQLVGAIGRGGARRKDLADPVRRKLECGRLDGEPRHALSTPSGQVRDEHVPAAQVEFGLVENPPAARSAVPQVEGTAQFDAEAGRCQRMRCGGSALGDQNPVDDLRDEPVGHGEEIVVGRAPPRRVGHAIQCSRRGMGGPPIVGRRGTIEGSSSHARRVPARADHSSKSRAARYRAYDFVRGSSGASWAAASPASAMRASSLLKVADLSTPVREIATSARKNHSSSLPCRSNASTSAQRADTSIRNPLQPGTSITPPVTPTPWAYRPSAARSRISKVRSSGSTIQYVDHDCWRPRIHSRGGKAVALVAHGPENA